MSISAIKTKAGISAMKDAFIEGTIKQYGADMKNLAKITSIFESQAVIRSLMSESRT